MNLFEIQARIDSLFAIAAENEGELSDDLASQLALAEEDLTNKLYAYSFVIDKYESDKALLKIYKADIDDRIKSLEARQAKLKNAIADAVYKFGEPVYKKNKTTGINEATGSYSYKSPMCTISVRPGVEIKTDEDIFNSFLSNIYNHFNANDIDELENKDVISTFIDVKLAKGISIDQAIKLKEAMKEIGIITEDGDFKFFVNNTSLKEALNNNPDGLDAWELSEKNIVTIRK